MNLTYRDSITFKFTCLILGLTDLKHNPYLLKNAMELYTKLLLTI